MKNFVLFYLLSSLLMITSIYELRCQEIVYGLNDGKYVEVQNRKVYYEEYGEGETILMLHGGPGSIADFSKLIPELAKTYKVIAMDTPGHGLSERAERLSYQFLAENASEFIDELGIEKCYVVGWSDGATTGLLLAAKRPNVVSKVFVSGGFANIDGFADQDKEMWSSITPELVEETWGGWHLEYQRLYPENDWRSLINDIRGMVSDKIYITEEQLKSIGSKVLLAFGDNDAFTLEHEVYLYRTIPDCELMILPGTGHSTFDEQPEMMLMAIKDFFEN